MKRKLQLISVTALIFIFAVQAASVFAQDKNRRTKAWPDSLSSVTLEGTVIIDSTHQNLFFLDVDGDDSSDYNLAFGPDWYVPESGAVLPEAGDYVTIVGSINPHPVIRIVMVFEINGLVWREPVENWWRQKDNCDSLNVITVSGTAMVDTTYYYPKYFLDEDGDEVPDYALSFGPVWYEPESGATRPLDGDAVTIEGAVKDNLDLTRLVVLKINDLIWRDVQGPAPWGGKWIIRDTPGNSRLYCPTDSSSWIDVPSGAMQHGGQHGMTFPDSLYCEFYQVWKDSLPGRPDSVLAGWHFRFFNPDSGKYANMGKQFKFMKKLHMHFCFSQGDSSGACLPKSSLTSYSLKYWNDDAQSWMDVEETNFDGASQAVTLDADGIETYYAVFYSTEGTSNVENSDIAKPSQFTLEQNYPNPFNPTTTIGYQIEAQSLIKISVYNVLGQEVRTLVNEVKPAGSHQVAWDGRDNLGNALPSGVYFYRLHVDNQVQIRRMVLMK